MSLYLHPVDIGPVFSVGRHVFYWLALLVSIITVYVRWWVVMSQNSRYGWLQGD